MGGKVKGGAGVFPAMKEIPDFVRCTHQVGVAAQTDIMYCGIDVHTIQQKTPAMIEITSSNTLPRDVECYT